MRSMLVLTATLAAACRVDMRALCDDGVVRLPALLWLLTSLAGCDAILRLDEVKGGSGSGGSDASVVGDGNGSACAMGTPRQQVLANESSANSLTFTVQPTTPGSTLVLTAAIATTSYNIATLVDDAGNTWHQAVTVQTPSTTTAALDIWYAANAASATSITATLSQSALRSMSVNLTEWPCTVPVPFDGAASTPGTASSAASTGMLTTANRDLVIGAVVFSSVSTNATLAGASGFTELDRFGTSNQVSARAAYGWVAPGTYELTWNLSPLATWVGGIVALKAQ